MFLFTNENLCDSNLFPEGEYLLDKIKRKKIVFFIQVFDHLAFIGVLFHQVCNMMLHPRYNVDCVFIYNVFWTVGTKGTVTEPFVNL